MIPLNHLSIVLYYSYTRRSICETGSIKFYKVVTVKCLVHTHLLPKKLVGSVVLCNDIDGIHVSMLVNDILLECFSTTVDEYIMNNAIRVMAPIPMA